VIDIEYRTGVPLPPAVRAAVEQRVENARKYLRWHPRDPRPHEILAGADALETTLRTSASVVRLRIRAVGTVEQTDDVETWRIYYLQLDDDTVVAIDGLTCDHDVIGAPWPSTEISVFWHTGPTRHKERLAIVPGGEALAPVFAFKLRECKWPYRPRGVLGGSLDVFARDPRELRSHEPAPEAAAALAEFLKILG
jgi:hypothetical protein